MSRLRIFKEAREILAKSKIEFTGEGNNREFWDVAGHGIEAMRTKTGWSFKCTCTHCSIYAGEEPFCSFQAALITYLVMK